MINVRNAEMVTSKRKECWMRLKMSLENVLLDVTITIVDNDTKEKAGQLRYIHKGSEIEILDTYIFPEHRGKKIMGSLLRRVISELRISGVSKLRLQYFDDDARAAWEKMGFKRAEKSGHMELCIE